MQSNLLITGKKKKAIGKMVYTVELKKGLRNGALDNNKINM